MRIFILRLLICSWFIPALWIITFPLFCLVSGKLEYEFDLFSEISSDLWNGRGRDEIN